MTKRFWSLCLAALLMTGPAFAQSHEEVSARIEALQGDPAGFAEAFDLLTEAMRFGDPVTVAQLAEYPLTVRANGEEYELIEARDLVDNYDRLVTVRLRRQCLQPDPLGDHRHKQLTSRRRAPCGPRRLSRPVAVSLP